MAVDEETSLTSDNTMTQGQDQSQQGKLKSPSLLQRIFLRLVQNFHNSKIKIGITVGIVIVAVCFLFWFFNRPIAKFESSLSARDYATAEAIYKQNMEDSSFLGSSEKAIDDIVNSYLEHYKNNDISCDDAIAEIEKLRSYAWGGSSNEEIQTIHTIENSRIAYHNAQEALKEDNYAEALKNFSLVDSEDFENYKNAQEQIEEVSEIYCEQAIEKATEALVKKDALSALTSLEAVDNAYRNQELTSLIDSTVMEAQTQAIEETNSLLAKEDYKNAYIYVQKLPESIVNGQIESLKSEIVSNLTKIADAKSNSGDYATAIALLTDDEGNALDQTFVSNIKKNEKLKNINTLQSLKGFFSVSYDSIEDSYTILPYGTPPISYQRNMIPTIFINENDDYMFFGLTFGFIDEDWIFTNEIIIDCDGQQFTLEYEFSDLETRIGWGYISEMAGFLDMGFDASEGGNVFVDLDPIVSAMTTAAKVTVRFSGDGKKDVTIPDSQIEQLSGFWTAYQILMGDPSLVSALA